MIQSPLNRVTSVRGHFPPINRKYFVLASMCESYSGPTKSGPIKWSRLYLKNLTKLGNTVDSAYSGQPLNRATFCRTGIALTHRS